MSSIKKSYICLWQLVGDAYIVYLIYTLSKMIIKSPWLFKLLLLPLSLIYYNRRLMQYTISSLLIK